MCQCGFVQVQYRISDALEVKGRPESLVMEPACHVLQGCLSLHQCWHVSLLVLKLTGTSSHVTVMDSSNPVA